MNKKERLKQKRNRILNKRLAKRYPFLIPRNWRSDKTVRDYKYDYVIVSPNDDGWMKSFFYLMMEELRAELVRTNCLYKFRIDQYKEKYGEMRLYCHGYKSDEIDRIISKYSVISSNICIGCGKPNVPQTDGWIVPLCDRCGKWKEYPGDMPIAREYSVRIYKNGNGIETITYDIGDTVDKVLNISKRRFK